MGTAVGGSQEGTWEMCKGSRCLAPPVGPPGPTHTQTHSGCRRRRCQQWPKLTEWSPQEMLPYTALGLLLTSILAAGVPHL